MRVIAGRARGRVLKAPRSPAIRPTGDKLKGAIFSALEALAYKLGCDDQTDDESFAAARAWPQVLDLYAGSGALGIEALSRGAASCDFVESDAEARRTIAENLRRTGLTERAGVHTTTVERAASTLPGSYDLILADPPYADAGAVAALAAVAGSGLVKKSTVLVWEHRHDVTPPERIGTLELTRTRRHGVAAFSLYGGPAGIAGTQGGPDAEHAGVGE